MLLLAGLGNPGSRYAGHRHNAGFMAVEAIASRHGFPAWKPAFDGLLTEGEIAGRRTLLFKPMDFMNNCGIATGELARFRKIPVENICVLHDELDLALGKIRVKRGGGDGGHNGIKSMDQYVGNETLRVRIGIGHPGDKELVQGHVLSNFTSEEMKVMQKVIAAMADAVPQLVEDDEARFMNDVALALREETEK